ncbi:MAG: hypothetical protein JSV88_21595 [Candidatus Aminicenantes bacterium]|nr:MAG: hypothetical protein JSV88_21595 [Candidatus Aminicenantes bacterium]
MKLNLKQQRLRIVLLSAGVVLFLAVILILVLGKGNAFMQRFLGPLFNWLAANCRLKIAYFSAIVLLVGTLILLLRLLPGASYKSTPSRSLPEKNQKKPLLTAIAIGVIILFWAPFLFQGADIHVKIFDNLDSHIPHTKVLAESEKALSLNPDTRLENFINGIALSGVDSGYNVLTWLFIIFPPFTAYALNDLLVRFVALLGMVLLLKTYIIKQEEEKYYWMIMGAALCFSLLPFYPAGGISIAGIPLLLYAFLNILNHQWKFTDFLIIFIFPFYSKLALAGFFITFALSILFVVDALRKKRVNFHYLGGLALLTISYCFTHFHLVYSFIDPNFSSFREEIRTVIWSTAESLKRTTHNFIFDRVNVVGAHHVFVLSAAALAMVVSVIKTFKRNDQNTNPTIRNKTAYLLAALVITTLLTSMIWGFKYWKGVVALREKFQLLNAFDFSRFFWFNPLLWYLIFALALVIISRIKYGKAIAAIFIVCQLMFMFVYYNWEYRHLLGIRSSFAGSPLTYSLTFKEFYSESLFEEINRYINRPKSDYRVVSLGIHPGISQYNGFYTLDIYTDIYPLEYKHQFRKIIEKELEKSEQLRKGFDGNAKRCFLMVSELHGIQKNRGLAFTRGITEKDQHLKIKHLDLDTDALKAMGGEYIFSAVEILNYQENNLKFERVFQRKESPWKIYLYNVL